MSDIIEVTDQFFQNHGIRLKKYLLPVPLPEGYETIDEVARVGREWVPYTTLYRHKHYLRQRILSNWSYIATPTNSPEAYRNTQVPFSLRQLTEDLNFQLNEFSKELDDREFSGLFMTMHTSTYHQYDILPNVHQPVSKVLGGALVEVLASNERCVKVIWLHPSLTPRSTRLILQAFLPRVFYEAFLLKLENPPEEGCLPKFVYSYHEQMDLFPRQAWMLMASHKYMGLRRHYEMPFTADPEPEDDEFTEALQKVRQGGHTDVSNNSGDVGFICSCAHVRQLCRQPLVLERLVGCSEEFMEERLKKSPKMDSWIDMIITGVDEELQANVYTLLPGGEIPPPTSSSPLPQPPPSHPSRNERPEEGSGETTASSLPTLPSSPSLSLSISEKREINWDLDEWCCLAKDDIEEIQSDVEPPSPSSSSSSSSQPSVTTTSKSSHGIGNASSSRVRRKGRTTSSGQKKAARRS